MHPTSRFHWADRAGMLGFVGARSFGTLVDAELRVAQAPVIVDEAENQLLLHLSRANPIARSMPARVVAVFSGADGYVSADWYGSADQVPTWNYESVEVTGTLAPTSEAMLIAILTRLGAEHEGRIAGKTPWTMDKVSSEFLETLVKAIVGATLTIESIRGTQKASQNKSKAEIDGVIAGLQRSPSPRDQELATRMMALRD